MFYDKHLEAISALNQGNSTLQGLLMLPSTAVFRSLSITQSSPLKLHAIKLDKGLEVYVPIIKSLAVMPDKTSCKLLS